MKWTPVLHAWLADDNENLLDELVLHQTSRNNLNSTDWLITGYIRNLNMSAKLKVIITDLYWNYVELIVIIRYHQLIAESAHRLGCINIKQITHFSFVPSSTVDAEIIQILNSISLLGKR